MRRLRCKCSSNTCALAALALALTSNALSITNVFPYAPFQVKYFGLTEDDRELGFYAGFIMTAYMIGAGLSAIPWGAFSDKYGKKAVIMIGLLANTAPQALYGLATSMPFALSIRFVMGLLNGLIGAAKALAPELVPPSEQAAAMSMIAATWGLGNLAGPAIGGLLSQYYLCEGDDTSSCPTFPFLPPNLLCAALSLAGLAAVRWLLPEGSKPPSRAQPSDGTSACAPAAEADTAVLNTSSSSSSAAAAAPEAAAGAGSAAAGEGSAPRVKRSHFTRQAAALNAFYGCIALNDIIHNEVFPLWCVAPAQSGGLELTSPQLGWVLSASGLALLGFQMIIFPPLSRRVSITRLCFFGCASSGVLYALLPFVTLLAEPASVIAALLLQQSLLRCALGCCFTCTFTILNNSVPAESRGRMQGVAMTVGSIARAVGPTMGAELFAWSLTNGLPLPFDVHFVFLLVCGMNLVPVAIAMATFTKQLDMPFEAAPAVPAVPMTPCTDTRSDTK